MSLKQKDKVAENNKECERSENLINSRKLISFVIVIECNLRISLLFLSLSQFISILLFVWILWWIDWWSESFFVFFLGLYRVKRKLINFFLLWPNTSIPIRFDKKIIILINSCSVYQHLKSEIWLAMYVRAKIILEIWVEL